jgi:hypothetical protein
VIEFEQIATGDPERRAPIVVNTEPIAHFEPLVGVENRCRLVLNDGRQVIAAIGYEELKRLLIVSRSGFATALPS